MYLKIKIADVLSGKIKTNVGKDLAKIFKKYKLNIVAEDDIGFKMLYQDIGEYRYALVKAYDLPNKNRMYKPSEEEINDIMAYVKKAGFEVVKSLPVQSDDLLF